MAASVRWPTFTALYRFVRLHTDTTLQALHHAYSWPHLGSVAPERTMNLHLSLTPLISLLAGILILLMPRLLNFIVAIYLILVGIIGLGIIK